MIITILKESKSWVNFAISHKACRPNTYAQLVVSQDNNVKVLKKKPQALALWGTRRGTISLSNRCFFAVARVNNINNHNVQKKKNKPMWFYAKQLDVLYVFFLLFKYQQRQSDTCKNTVFYCFLYETFFYIHIQNQMYRHKKQAYVQINNLIISLLLSSYNILKLKTKMYNAWTLNIAQHLVIVSF